MQCTYIHQRVVVVVMWFSAGVSLIHHMALMIPPSGLYKFYAFVHFPGLHQKNTSSSSRQRSSMRHLTVRVWTRGIHKRPRRVAIASHVLGRQLDGADIGSKQRQRMREVGSFSCGDDWLIGGKKSPLKLALRMGLGFRGEG